MKVSNITTEKSDLIRDFSDVKIGHTIDWWRPNSSFPAPQNYMICDGSVVTDPASPLYGVSVPNLIESFVRGHNFSNLNGTGGSNSLNFSHVHATAHTHVLDHGHTGSTSDTNLDWNNVPRATGSGGGGVGTHHHNVGIYNSSLTSNADSLNSGAVVLSGSGDPTNVDRTPPWVGMLKLIRIK